MTDIPQQAPLDEETRLLLSSAQNDEQAQLERLRKLENQVDQLSLLNESLWHLLSSKTRLTNSDLQESLEQVKARRRTRDQARLSCTKCKLTNATHHKKCIYCGGELSGNLPAAELFDI